MSELTGYDWQGQPEYGTEKEVRCSVIYFQIGQADTSIRADRSETKGRAEEAYGKIRILVEPRASIQAGQRMKLDGETLRVLTVFPRHGLGGKLHHYQVDLEVWPDEQE